MGNQNSLHASSSSVRSITTAKSSILSMMPRVKSMKSEISINHQNSTMSCNEKEVIKDLKAMNKFNQMKKENINSTLGIPTVFKWNGKGTDVFISGSFNSWNENIAMKKSEKVFFTIVNCEPGHLSYKFLVNGVWMHDETQPTELNSFGTLNNWIEIAEEDLDIELALNYDEKHSKKSPEGDYNENPETEYGQEIPRKPNPVTGMTIKNIQPRTLPPYLNDAILNIEVAQHHDPNLLITPYHVQINHLYASSISSGIASLSVTVRYRNKYITTLFYKPISD